MDVRYRVGAAVGIALCAVAVGGATRYMVAAPHGAVRPTPAPESHTRIENVDRAEVMRYVAKLSFDTSYHAIDSRRLFERRDGKLFDGAFATIAPEAGSTRISWSELDSGRVMARVTADAAMPSRGFAKGDNYIKVENRNGHLHGVTIPADPNTPEKPFRVAIVHKNIGPARAPQARFRWNKVLGDDVIWWDCAYGCCTADPDTGPGPQGQPGVPPGVPPVSTPHGH